MEPELVGLLLAVVGSGLPAAAARFLRRRKLSVDDSPQRAQVSADATLAEAADIARADGATEVTAVAEHRAVGILRVPQVATQTAPRARAKRFDITFADVVYGIAMIVGIGAKAIWDYENKYHKPGINWLQVNLALLVAPIVYIGIGSHLKVASNGAVSLPGLALAFQNGFFWQTVFSTANGSVTSHSA